MIRRAVLGFFALITCLLPLLGPGVTAVRADGDLKLELLDQTPAVLVGPSDVALRLRITNNTTDVIADPVAEVRLQTWTPAARNRIAHWYTGRDDTRSTPLLNSTLKPLKAGERREFTLTVPKAQLPNMSRGPRGILVRVAAASLSDGAGDGAKSRHESPTAITRSYLINWPSSAIPPAKFLVLAPLAPSAADIKAAPDSIAASAELSQKAAKLASSGVKLVSDPDITGIAENPPLMLPSGDPDITYLAASEAGRKILAETTSVGSGVPLLWWPTVPTSQAISTRPVDSVLVLPDDVVNRAEGTHYTPSGIAMIANRPALVIDTGMSKLVSQPDNEVSQRQALLANAAAAIRERPNDPRTFVLALPRNVDASVATERLRALLDSPLALPAQLPTLKDDVWQGGGQSGANTWKLSNLPESGDSEQLLARLAKAHATADSVASATSNPSALTGPINTMAKHLLASSLSDDPTGRLELLDQLEQRATRLSDAIGVETPSSLLLISDQPDIPFQLRSSLPAVAKVKVSLIAQDPRLQTPKAVSATLPPGGRATVEIPVTAVGSGDLKVRVQIENESGQIITSSKAFEVRIRADWENFGTAIAAGLLAFLVLGGIFRTIRRNRITGVRGIRIRRPTIPRKGPSWSDSAT